MGKRKINKEATFKWKPSTQYSTFLDLGSVGWINRPIDVGVLVQNRKEKGRYVFEFKLKEKTINAWSSIKSWGDKNFKLLKKGHAYVLEGKILAQRSSKKYFPASNSTYKYSLLLNEISVIKEEKQKQVRSNISKFSEIRDKIATQRSFVEDVKKVKIISGNLFRYIGCEKETCFARIQKSGACSGKEKNYCANKCLQKTGSRKGVVCILLRDVCIENSKNEKIEGITVFHGECKNIFGESVIKRICTITSDQRAEKQCKKFFGCLVNATIYHQKSRRSSQHFDIILKRINVISAASTEIQSDGEDKFFSDAECSVPSNSNCPCETLDTTDEVDFDQIRSLLTNPPIVQRDTAPAAFNDSKYELWINPTTKKLGLAFVVNIKTGKGLKARKGSEKDVEIIEKVLPKLGIGIFGGNSLQDIDKQTFESKLQDFKQELVNENYSCSMVIIMSHGVLHNMRLTDEYINVWKDVMFHFSEENFSDFFLKPKIFVMHSCQYFTEKTFSICTNFQMDGQRFSDSLWITPCLPGVKAKRHPEKGSYFIQVLMMCLEEYGEFLNLMDVFNKVQNRMRNIPVGNEKKEYNVPVFSSMFFCKSFYFTPGNPSVPLYDITTEGVLE